jgi:hypothetical protein
VGGQGIMTNKEALEILKTEWDINAEIFDTNFHEALAVAIKVLEERPQGEWRPLSLKTLNGDDIVAYESSCCGAIADKKYQRCPNCGVKMRGEEEKEVRERRGRE